MANEKHKYDFVDGINYACGGDHLEVDSNYEFDADNFFDFTRSETTSEVGQADAWFNCADSYPPSPFAMKLIIEQLLASQQCCTSSKAKESQNENVNSNSLEAKSKPVNKPAESRSLSYMKPTASLLAKQDKLQEANCKHFFCRPVKPEVKRLRSPRYEDLLSKRQKLEKGYLWKVAQQNHRRLLLQKTSKNVTIPKEPQLETMLRAERRSSKNTSESSENANTKLDAVKGRSRYRNIVKESSRLSSRTSVQELLDCHVLDTHWDDSVSQSSVASIQSSTPKGVPKKQYFERSIKSNTHPLKEKEYGTSNEERLFRNPPIEMFSKLSIKTRSESNMVSQTRLGQCA